MITILMVFGTRPEAIKMAPLIHELKKSDLFNVIVCSTGQHIEMVEQVSEAFDIEIDFNLKVMLENQKLPQLVAHILNRVDDLIIKSEPDLVLVHGDTATTFAATLASFYNKIKVGHVEAGLRTGNKLSPWPEEMNRQLVADMADFHFAPTETNKANLLREGISESKIFITGNTVIDALKYAAENKVSEQTVEYERKRVLFTGHRRENWGTRFNGFCEAILELSKVYKNVDFVFPMHKNPLISGPAREVLSGLPNVYLIDPLPYLEFVKEMRGAHIIVTDSGGIQEEAPYFGVPVVVTRENTERVEAIEAGTIKLVGVEKENIVREISKLLDDEGYHSSFRKKENPYGDGFASGRIVSILQNYFIGAK